MEAAIIEFRLTSSQLTTNRENNTGSGDLKLAAEFGVNLSDDGSLKVDCFLRVKLTGECSAEQFFSLDSTYTGCFSTSKVSFSALDDEHDSESKPITEQMYSKMYIYARQSLQGSLLAAGIGGEIPLEVEINISGDSNENEA